jgi:DNA repair exonuclease SbcCD nuclease subunit
MYFVGDLHSLFKELLKKIEKEDIKDEIIIVLGDNGFGLTNIDDENNINYVKNVLDPFLKERNIKVYAIRGNHDDKRFYMGKYMNFFKNIFLVPDYTVLKLEDKNILFIGGAISVDRIARKNKELNDENLAGRCLSYFDNECLTLTDFQKQFLEKLTDIDIVATHTAPSWCPPFLNIKVDGDYKLADDITKEREIMSEIFDILKKNNKISKHYYGHFHKNMFTEVDKIDHECLDELQFKYIY